MSKSQFQIAYLKSHPEFISGSRYRNTRLPRKLASGQGGTSGQEFGMTMSRISNGFTLLELMIVIGILGLLILFSSISYFSLKQRTALTSMVDEVISATRTVQGWAMAGQDGTPTQCLTISTTEIKSPCGCTTACKLHSGILSGITIAPLGDYNFTRLTGLPATPVTFTISSGTLSKTVTVAANGKISS